MKTIEFASPFLIGEDSIVKAEIARLPFSKFVALSRQALAVRKGNQKLNVITQRYRMMEQSVLVSSAGKKVKLTEDQVLKLPPLAGRDLADSLFFDDELPGKLLSDPKADGISTAIHYQLGTPIKAAQGKEIAEIEFLAKSFGDLEEVLAGEADLFQTLDMITTMAKPVGGTMLALPSWAAEQMSLADGIFIMNNVLPRFLG